MVSFVIRTPLSIDVFKAEHVFVATADLLDLALSLETTIAFCVKLSDVAIVLLRTGVAAGPLNVVQTLLMAVTGGVTVGLSSADWTLVTFSTASETGVVIGTGVF